MSTIDNTGRPVTPITPAPSSGTAHRQTDCASVGSGMEAAPVNSTAPTHKCTGAKVQIPGDVWRCIHHGLPVPPPRSPKRDSRECADGSCGSLSESHSPGCRRVSYYLADWPTPARAVLGPWQSDGGAGMERRDAAGQWRAYALLGGAWGVADESDRTIAGDCADDLPSAMAACDAAIRANGWYGLAEDSAAAHVPNGAMEMIARPLSHLVHHGTLSDGSRAYDCTRCRNEYAVRADHECPAPAWLDPAITSRRVPRWVIAECAEALAVALTGTFDEEYTGRRSRFAENAAAILDAPCGTPASAAVLSRARALGYDVEGPTANAPAPCDHGNVALDGDGEWRCMACAAVTAEPPWSGKAQGSYAAQAPAPPRLSVERLRELREIHAHLSEIASALDELIALREGA